MPASLLLNLDLANQDLPAESELLARVGDPNTTILRATDFGAPTSPTGSPSDWNLAAAAVFRIAHEVRRTARAIGQTPRIFITGRAGLPLFVQLGSLLSARVLEFSLLNRRKDSTHWDRLDFPPPPNPPSHPDNAPFFALRHGLDENHNHGRIAISVSTHLPRAPNAACLFLEKNHEPIAAEIQLRTHVAPPNVPDTPATTWLTGINAPNAAAELMDTFGRLPVLFPNAKSLAIFIDGPATLAFLVGRAIVPRLPLHNNVWIPSFHHDQYHDALRLPFQPPISIFIVHADEDDAFAERLQHKTLARANVRFWHQGMIEPGQHIEQVTLHKLNEAQIILVVVSPHVSVHDTTHNLIERALECEQHHNAIVIPVLARQCNWKADFPTLGARKALPAHEQWLKSATDNDNLWTDVDRGLRSVVDHMHKNLFGEEA